METRQITTIRNALNRRKEIRQGLKCTNIAYDLWIASLSYETGLTVEFIIDNLEIIKEL
jgi:hypothetical protein